MVAQEFLEKILEGYDSKIENHNSIEERNNYIRFFLGLYGYMEGESYDVSRFIVKYQKYKSLSKTIDMEVSGKG